MHLTVPLFIRYGLAWQTQDCPRNSCDHSYLLVSSHVLTGTQILAWRNISMLVFATQITPVVLRVMFSCELSLRNLAAVIIPILPCCVKTQQTTD